MRAKSITQLWRQLERIRGYFDNPNNPKQAERLNKACEACNRYGRNAWEYVIANNPGISNTDALFVPVPVKEYTANPHTQNEKD